jgi:hypothetical protein
MSRSRTLAAFIVAPMATPVAFCLLSIFSAHPIRISLNDAFSYLAVDAIYCLPVAYIAELSLGLAAWKILCYYRISSLLAFASSGALMGAVVALVMGCVASGSISVVLRPLSWDRPWVLTAFQRLQERRLSFGRSFARRLSATWHSMKIEFTIRVFKEGRMFVAYAPELDVSSGGHSTELATENLKEAVRLFLETCEDAGTLAQVLAERRDRRYPLPDGRGSVSVSEIKAVRRGL